MNKQEVKDYLISEFEKTGFIGAVTIDTPVGECCVTPCFYGDMAPTIDSIEYFMVSGPVPWLGNSNFEVVCEDIANMENLVYNLEKEKEDLKRYYEENVGTEHFDASWYSDWHKDLYGFRPRGDKPGEYVPVDYYYEV